MNNYYENIKDRCSGMGNPIFENVKYCCGIFVRKKYIGNECLTSDVCSEKEKGICKFFIHKLEDGNGK